MTTTWRLGLAGAAVAALLTGCGSGGGNDFADQSPKDIAKATSADMKDLKSLRMSGEITAEGQQLTLDMNLTTSGDCQGTISVGKGTAELISSGGKAYIKPDKAFWEDQAPASAAQIEAVVGDKWVVIPSASQLDAACDLNRLLDEFDGPGSDPSDAPTSATADSVDGQDAVKLSGKDSDGKPLTAWVATDSPHYLLKMQLTAGNEPGTITFSDFDKTVTVDAPSPDDTVDLSKLGG
jgi:hypothetical protein